jgi:hypothetical protein
MEKSRRVAPAEFFRSSIGLDRGGRRITLPRWQRDNPAVVAPFRQLAEIAQHLQCLLVAVGQMREDLGGDPAQMRIIWYHMRSPGVTRPHRAASGYGYAGTPAWQAECRAMVNAKGGRRRSRITWLLCRLAMEATSREAHQGQGSVSCRTYESKSTTSHRSHG